MPKEVFCHQSETEHARPVERNCKRGRQVSGSSTNEVSAPGPSQSDTSSSGLNSDIGDKILNKLTAINDQMVSLEGRVRLTEATLANRTTDRPMPSSPTGSDRQTSNVAALNLHSDIVPSTDFLKSNTAIQNQVDARFQKFVAWPQHYVFASRNKGRITYNQLDPIQWMSGCLQSALDLPEPDKLSSLASHYGI